MTRAKITADLHCLELALDLYMDGGNQTKVEALTETQTWRLLSLKDVFQIQGNLL
jgi:hypothetical protein